MKTLARCICCTLEIWRIVFNMIEWQRDLRPLPLSCCYYSRCLYGYFTTLKDWISAHSKVQEKTLNAYLQALFISPFSPIMKRFHASYFSTIIIP